ncbi:unnamed protein product [Rhizoctonia solani]|uniref:Zn(2)-C6 fungal-type domain-containing protein n=1 Tax=Rhizoctonia solani TaxID=456999 RepID=A0A8H3DN43_9AGAM|nr:unnamed protein product [Rhizoctonia solani]
MPRLNLKPGPVPKSCLTCRQRRKKCDLSRPYCNRCLKGGYDCLGYERSEPCATAHQEGPTVPNSSRSGPISPAGLQARSEAPNSVAVEVSEEWQGPVDTNTGCDPKPSASGAAPLYGMSRAISLANEDCASTNFSDDFDRLWPEEPSKLMAYSHPRTHQACAGRVLDANSTVKPTRSSLSRVLGTLFYSIPSSVNATQMMGENHFSLVLSEYDFQRLKFWFAAPAPAIRGYLEAQLKESKKMKWTLHLGASLYRALSQDPRSATVQGYIGWIDKLDQKFTTISRSNLPLDDVADLLMVQLELASLKFSIVDSSSGYVLLQKAVPRFLQLVAADTNLYTEHPDGNLVASFPRTLCAPRHELERFVIYDTIAALLLGVPPLIEYGYDGECDSSLHKLEWMHGIPVALVEIISQINSWRAGSSVPLDDWQALERRVLAWQTPPPASDEASTTECISIGRVSVQESWRHVVLIYIYMVYPPSFDYLSWMTEAELLGYVQGFIP